MLKSRRIEYTFGHYNSVNRAVSNFSEMADLNLVGEMKFHSARMLQITNLVGANLALFAYHSILSPFRYYLRLPLTFAVFVLARNMSLRNFMDRIYYPI